MSRQDLGYRCGVKKRNQQPRVLALAEEGGNASNYMGKTKRGCGRGCSKHPRGLAEQAVESRNLAFRGEIWTGDVIWVVIGIFVV